MTANQGNAAIDAFERLFVAAVETILVELRDFQRANEMLRRPGINLRAGDALHLAIAANRDARQIVALDKDLIRAARRLKLKRACADLKPRRNLARSAAVSALPSASLSFRVPRRRLRAAVY